MQFVSTENDDAKTIVILVRTTKVLLFSNYSNSIE